MKTNSSIILKGRHLLLSLSILFLACSEIDFTLPQGPKGDDGLSAYEIWKDQVENGEIDWSKDRVDIVHFFQYLKGKDGENGKDGVDGKDGEDGVDGKDGENGKDGVDGKTAYEIWKEMAENGELDDPQNPGEKWPSDKVEIHNFYEYLTGQDGKDGKDGLDGEDGKSAYELWKQELEDKCGTSDALLDHKTGDAWPCEANSTDDFWDFLTGKDGSDGENGMPGETGSPGDVVEIIRGVPNVIAQYSQQEYSEYVRPSDGGVGYIVYGEDGEIAPNAIVKGLPGIDPDKEYMADAYGQFFIPKEDLPSLPNVSDRWGTTKYVTIDGVTKESAQNTYVPNRIFVRMILSESKTTELDFVHKLYFTVQRKTDPGMAWKPIPDYLPNISSQTFTALQISDPDDPGSVIEPAVQLAKTYGRLSNTTIDVSPKRFMVENLKDEMNYLNTFWDGNENYATVIMDTPFYGEDVKWNGTLTMAPYQLGPYIAEMTLKGYRDIEESYFEKANGIFDFSRFDFNLVYEKEMTKTGDPNTIEQVVPTKMDEDKARNMAAVYIEFIYTSLAGNQDCTSEKILSSSVSPDFICLLPFLNSSVNVKMKNGFGYFAKDYTFGKLKGVPFNFYIDCESNKMPDVEITYEP